MAARFWLLTRMACACVACGRQRLHCCCCCCCCCCLPLNYHLLMLMMQATVFGESMRRCAVCASQAPTVHLNYRFFEIVGEDPVSKAPVRLWWYGGTSSRRVWGPHSVPTCVPLPVRLQACRYQRGCATARACERVSVRVNVRVYVRTPLCTRVFGLSAGGQAART